MYTNSVSSHESSSLPTSNDTTRDANIDVNTQTPVAPLTIIHMSSTDSFRLPTEQEPEPNHTEHPPMSGRRKVSVKQISISYLRRRLCVREYYYTRLVLVSNTMCMMGILGIVLMVIGNELTFTRMNENDSEASWIIKLIITLTTIILLILILYYHYLDITFYSFRNLVEDWRIELTTKRMLLIGTELLICAIHPVPRSHPHDASTNTTEPDSHSLSYTAVDVGLGLPMFLRLYLVGRCIMLHSHLVHDISLRSVGYLNQVSIDFYFLLKTYLEQWPTRCLIAFCAGTFFIGSWSLRACDYTLAREHMSMSDAMWLFVITFTTIGYGDQYPSTYCGRSIAAVIGFIGLILSALLIAILANKLLLTREEKYVHTFVLNTKLARSRRNHAANVIKFALKVWYFKRQNRVPSIQYLHAQRKLFRAIHALQETRQEQRRLDDHCVGHIELMTVQQHTLTHTTENIKHVATFKKEVNEIKEELYKLNSQMSSLQETLQALLNKGSPCEMSHVPDVRAGT